MATPLIDSLVQGQGAVGQQLAPGPQVGAGGGFAGLIDKLKGAGKSASDTLFGVSPAKRIEEKADEKAQEQYIKQLKRQLIEEGSDLSRARAQVWYSKGVFTDADLQEVLEGIAQKQTETEGDETRQRIDGELKDQEDEAARQQQLAMIQQATDQGYPPGSPGFSSLMQPGGGPELEQGDILSQLMRGLG